MQVIRSLTESAWPEDRQFRVGCWRCGGLWSGEGGAGALQWSGGVGGAGRRHRWNWLKAIIKGGGLPALLSLLWESGDAGTEIKRSPCGFTFPKEVEADT